MMRIESEELAVRVALRGGTSLSDARDIVGGVGEAIRDAVVGGESVRFLGFGLLEARDGYRATRDPQAGVMRGRGRKRIFFRGVALEPEVDCG